MTLDTFFEKFNLFADAPGAVAKMRELILQLAVIGQLCPQDSSEEPASALLSRIAGANKSRYASGEIRLRENAKLSDGVEVSLPEGWSSVALGEIADVNWGNTTLTKKSYCESGFTAYSATGPDGWIDHAEFSGSGIVLSAIGARSGKCFLAEGQWTAIKNTITIIPFSPISNDWLFRAINREGAWKRRGGAQPFIALKDAISLSLLLPPLAEQKRIVAKVDELMALCDRLEAQQQKRESQHAVLARASLARFADEPTPASLDFIFHKSYTISPADLRKSILTLAVQGRLVPQDPDDEPANELLAKIECNKVRLAREQGVRLPKNVPPITADDYPLDIPDSWQWSRIGHLALVIDYGTSQKADSDSAKVPVYRMGNIVGGRLIDENMKYVDKSIEDLPGLYLKTNDLLFNRTNSYELVGKAGIYTGPDDTATFASYLIRIRLPETLLFPPFYSVAMNAPYYRQTQIEPEVVQQCGQANFNGSKLASTVVPIPPLTEQRRIVAKVDQLMTLVDALETQLAASRAAAANLLSALVAELTGTAVSAKSFTSPVSSTGRRGRPRKSP